MYYQASLLDTHNATSSQESADGVTRCDSPDGQTTGPCGPAPAPANLSARQAKAQGLLTIGTSGQHSGGSSLSADLQSSLESRLRAALDVNGSPEYALTWKHWDMQSGPPICALRASARRTSDSGRGGWPTPTKGNAEGSQMARDATTTGRRPDGSKATVSLNHVAQAAGYPAPRANDAEKRGQIANDSDNTAGKYYPSKRQKDLDYAAFHATGWATPTARDWRSESATAEHDAKRNAHPRGKPLSYQATGATTHGSPAQTEKRGALNPALSRWLMGYPDAWLSCVDWATLSSRKSRQSS